MLIHTGQTVHYEKDGILEEVLLHEAAHTSLDMWHERADSWIKNQKADGRFITKYAQENPEREDLAESFLLYFALRYQAARISRELRDSIQSIIPNRIEYFDNLKLDMYPFKIGGQ